MSYLTVTYETLIATGENDALAMTIQFSWHAGQYRMADVEKTDKASGYPRSRARSGGGSRNMKHNRRTYRWLCFFD